MYQKIKRDLSDEFLNNRDNYNSYIMAMKVLTQPPRNRYSETYSNSSAYTNQYYNIYSNNGPSNTNSSNMMSSSFPVYECSTGTSTPY